MLITQWLTGPLDGNVLCPGRDRLAASFFGPFTRARTAGVPALLVTPVPHPDIEAAQRAQAALEAEQAKRDQQAQKARDRGSGRGEEGPAGPGHARPGCADQAPVDPHTARARTDPCTDTRTGRVHTPTDARTRDHVAGPHHHGRCRRDHRSTQRSATCT